MFIRVDFPEPEHPTMAPTWFLRNKPLTLFKMVFFSETNINFYTKLARLGIDRYSPGLKVFIALESQIFTFEDMFVNSTLIPSISTDL
jgi:hypothetical protein